MAKFASSTTLRRVSTATKKLIDGWSEGRHLETESAHTLEELRARVASDRVGLAKALLRNAERLAAQLPPLYRAAVSRGYYATYHAMRAAAYVFHGGDDHQEHKTLPKAPTDMTTPNTWSNKLKDARERRNQADYDRYPKSEAAWRVSAAASPRRGIGSPDCRPRTSYTLTRRCVGLASLKRAARKRVAPFVWRLRRCAAPGAWSTPTARIPLETFSDRSPVSGDPFALRAEPA